MLLDDAVRDFLCYLRAEQGATAATHKCYQNRLRHFLRWLAENGYPDAGLDVFNTSTLRRYQYTLSSKGLRPRSVRGSFNALRSFGTFLMNVGVLQSNPAKEIGLPKKDAAERLLTNEEQVRQLLDACERQRDPKKVALSRALFSVFIFTGLRRSECLNLKVGDMDLTEGRLTVRHGKGEKARTAFLCADCLAALRAWMDFRPKDCRHDWLFALDRNRRIYHDGLRILVEQVNAIAGFQGKQAVRPHSLRHFFGTHLLQSGANIRDVQEALGHSHLTTTATYLHTSEQQMRNIAHLASLHTQKPEPARQGEIVRLPFAERARSKRIAR